MNTQCNYCTISKMAAGLKPGLKFSMLPAPLEGFPKGISIHIYKEGEKPNELNWVAWFGDMTEHCVCNQNSPSLN